MKPGAGSRKGGAFERWVGKRLSLWLTGGKDGTQLVRSKLSGGWKAGRGGADPWRQAGDLEPNGPAGEAFKRRFAVECKHRREIELWPLLTGESCDLTRWWDKIATEAAGAGATPMLIFKTDRRPVMAMISSGALDRRTLDGWLLSTVGKVTVVEWLGVVTFPLTDLLECDPERVLRAAGGVSVPAE